MARKSKEHLLTMTPHVPNEVKASIRMFCPLLKCGGTKDIITCLYRCPKTKLVKCKEYLRVYPELLNFEIDAKYIEKYGEVTLPLPMSLRKRRKRRAPNAAQK